jgi:hypothetical protein
LSPEAERQHGPALRALDAPGGDGLAGLRRGSFRADIAWSERGSAKARELRRRRPSVLQLARHWRASGARVDSLR